MVQPECQRSRGRAYPVAPNVSQSHYVSQRSNQVSISARISGVYVWPR